MQHYFCFVKKLLSCNKFIAICKNTQIYIILHTFVTMPRKRNLRANKSNKNRYGEPLFGSVTPRRLTPKRTTPIRFTRAKYTPAKIPPNTAQKKKPEPKSPEPPKGTYTASKKKFPLGKKTKTKAKIQATELPNIKKEERKKRAKNF